MILTGRFALHLASALLTFLIGVVAANLLGHFKPLDGHHTRSPSRRCGERHRWISPPPAPLMPQTPGAELQRPPTLHPIFSPQSALRKTVTPSHPTVTPVLPSFEDAGEIKAQATAPTRRSR